MISQSAPSSPRSEVTGVKRQLRVFDSLPSNAGEGLGRGQLREEGPRSELFNSSDLKITLAKAQSPQSKNRLDVATSLPRSLPCNAGRVREGATSWRTDSLQTC